MIHLQNLCAPLGDHLSLNIEQLCIEQNTSWAIIGSNGSGKSALAALFSGRLPYQQGSISGLIETNVSTVSFEVQQQLIDREQERDDSDITNQVWPGTPVIELLQEVSDDQPQIQHWVSAFAIEHLLNKGFRKLSTGESRKVILIRALLQTETFLVLDEPFDGLDANSQQALKDILYAQHNNGRQMLFILNRLDEVPNWISHLGFLHNLKLLTQGEKQTVLNDETVKAFLTFNNHTLALPSTDNCCPKLDAKITSLVTLVNGKVAYSDRLIFDGLNWQINRGEHWAVLGPNGCGKSTLLNLISGD
ncbi:MAG: molybdenum ABC transporter ATP-binding protein, partial [Bermanella sp.]|nr:molybdenum ABC transporter ATP-binding protein [Bermanella sp.]